jgi:PAS domain S-box-containing protein
MPQPNSSAIDILVVDDTPTDLKLLTQLLSQAGYRPRIAQTGATALQSIQLRSPDLILLDIRLPDVDGYTVCQEICRQAPVQIPVIFISGLEQSGSKVKAFDAGGIDYVTKPYEADELLARIQRHLTHQQLQRSIAIQNQALRAQDERWQLLLQGTRDSIFDWNIQTGEITASASFMLGYRAEEQPKAFNDWVQLLHPQDRDRTLSYVNAYLARQQPTYHIEFRMRCRDGQYKWVLSRGQAIWNADGQPLRMVGIHHDISDRKQAELALQTQLQKSLLLSQITDRIRQSLDPAQLFRTATAQLGEAMQTSRCLIYEFIDGPAPTLPLMAEYLAGPGISSILRLPDVAVDNVFIQQLLTDPRAIACDDVATDPRLATLHDFCRQINTQSALAAGTFYQTCPNGIVAVHQCDRLRHWTPDEIELVQLVAAQIGIAIAQARLIEQERQQRQALEASNRSLMLAKKDADDANQAKSRFLANMSHELRTPLNAILGYTQLLLSDTSLALHQIHYLQIILNNGDYLLSLINDVLNLAKIEAGKQGLAPAPFNLSTLLTSLEHLFQEQARQGNLRLILDRDPTLPNTLITDAQKLRQVVINLLSNALKFTPTGQVTLRVLADPDLSHDSDPPTHYLTIQVEDTGVGMTPEEQRRIFRAFEQTAAGQQISGSTGLGLAISQQLVALLGGRLQVRSQVGQGSLFYFTIPVQYAPEGSDEDLPPNPIITGIADADPPPILLVVDDQATERQLLVDMLTPVGFTVLTASTGAEAIAQWQTQHPDLLIIDLRLGAESGHTVIQQIQAAGDRNPVPIIAISASTDAGDRLDTLGVACPVRMEKPLRRSHLLEQIAALLNLTLVYACPLPLPLAKAPPITVADLQVMPQRWIEQLYTFARQCNSDRIDALVAEIPNDYADLRQALTYYSYNLDVATILNLAHQCLGDRPLDPPAD